VFIQSFSSFIRDDRGGYTVWSLTWFMLYVALGGIAVDMSDAFRNQTLLQSTADASALAGVISLSDQADVVNQAMAYSVDNMDVQINGGVLNPAEVTVGTWDFAARTFTPGGSTPNAVRAVTRRDSDNNNPLATAFLPILAFAGIDATRFNISVEAVAARGVPSCINDGFVALNTTDMRSNNGYYNDICIHGQNVIVDPGQNHAVDLQNGNFFELGVQVSMPDLNWLPNRQNLCNNNTGLCDAKVEGDLWPKDIARLGDIIAGLRRLDPDYLPEFMVTKDASGDLQVAGGVTIEEPPSGSLPPTLTPMTVYVLNCNGQVQLPGVLIEQVVIVATCRIHSSSGTHIEDAVLATDYTGSNAAIHMAAQSTLGRADYCTDGGGLEIYTPGDVHLAAQGEWHGLRIVSGGEVKFTSKNVGIHGMSVQAINIDMSSNNDFGLCAGGVPGRPAWHYALVR